MGTAKKSLKSTQQQIGLLPLEARLGLDAVESAPVDDVPDQSRCIFGPVMFPMPPSVNAYWRTRVIRLKNATPKQIKFTGGFSAMGYIAPEAQAWRDQIKEMFLQISPRPAMTSNPLCVEIVVCFADNRKSDIDNRVKPALDGLKHAGLMEDDSQVLDLRVRRGPVIKQGRIVVRVWEIVPNFDRALYSTGWGKLPAESVTGRA